MTITVDLVCVSQFIFLQFAQSRAKKSKQTQSLLSSVLTFDV